MHRSLTGTCRHNNRVMDDPQPDTAKDGRRMSTLDSIDDRSKNDET